MPYQVKNKNMEVEIITTKLHQIIDEILQNIPNLPIDISYDAKLSIILSESNQALELITSIEDEFDFDFDDEEINIDLFENIDMLIASISNHTF